jgi:class 3 adenylate cyclase/tetratricopeptide (TPR) repeat protein
MSAQATCRACGSENDTDSRFCRSCGAALVNQPPAPAGGRKVVTILFSDIVDSTKLGEKLDPESLRRFMTRYFNRMKAILQRHGGTPEKFIGDAIMAVFGVPRAHEDDALRAVRAAAEMRDTLQGLNEEFERGWGIRILTRTGIGTGEVMTGDPKTGATFVTGDAVNMAARLEESAQPGEILICETTYRLVRSFATVEALNSVVAKGKAEPVSVWGLRGVATEGQGRISLFNSPLVGRVRELGVLQESFQRVVDARVSEAVTVLGAAGVGKSRLTQEFLLGLGDDVRVVRGRCLPYGEGITFWPIVGVLREAAGITELDSAEESRHKLVALLESRSDATVIGERLANLLGLSDTIPGIQETFWAVRKLLEGLAASRPLVVVFDDIHWGETTFLDLLEYLVDWLQGVPIMLLCLARPELVEIRSAWMVGKTNASLLTLMRLNREETDRLLQNLLGHTSLTEGTRADITEVAEGNPLFVEETLRMLVDEGLLLFRDGSWALTADLSSLTIPPTIQALLAARLDMLNEGERAILERASVIGRVFWWGAVSELSPKQHRHRVGTWLQSLIRKELIRPDRSDLGDEDTFRFMHILIRDAAYRRLPKTSRAELHEQFAQWLIIKTRDMAGEYDEIIGYHFEQAYRALSELGPMDERTPSLGWQAAMRLGAAGRRAYARGDMPAAVNLLSRAASLAPREDADRIQLLPELAFAFLQTGDFAGMQVVLADLKQAATTFADPNLQAHALILDLWIRLFTHPEGWAGEAYREATRAISMFESQGDERGLAKGWAQLGLFHMMEGQFGMSLDAWEKAAAHAASAGDRREELECLAWVPVVVWCGPTPIEEGIRRCLEVLDRAEEDRKATSVALSTWGALEAMRGRFDRARELCARAKSILQEVSLPGWMGALTQMSGWVEILAGDPIAAEEDLRWGVEILRGIGELSWLSTTAAILAEAMYAQGRLEEAESFVRVSEEAAGSDDTYSQPLLRSVKAKVLARRGRADEAERLMREAIVITEPTDFLFLKGTVLRSFAEILNMAGRRNEAEPVLVEAIRMSEQKGDVIGVEQARAMLQAPA